MGNFVECVERTAQSVGVKCGVWSVKRGGECEMWNLKSVQCKVRSIKCRIWNLERLK